MLYQCFTIYTMGNTSTKAMKKRQNQQVIQNATPPLSKMTEWKNNMQTFMKTHITQLQNYSHGELDFVKYRLQRLIEGHPVPYRSFEDERFMNALAEIGELMTNLGNWQVMHNKSQDLVNWYVSQYRQDDLEEIAFIFCILVIEPQIRKTETTWSWTTI